MQQRVNRKPPTYLAIFFPIFVCGGVGVVLLLAWMYSVEAGVGIVQIPLLNGILISIPAVLLWVPISLVATNVVLQLVPDLRRVAEGYAHQTGTPGFVKSQRQLLRFILLVATICVPLILLGFFV